MTSGFFTTKPPGKPWIACWRESSMCFIHLCRLFTTQSFDFSGSNLPGANLLLTQQPAQLTLTSLKTCQWVSTQQMINSPTYEFSKSALAYWGTPPALVFTSDTLSFALSMQFLLPQSSFLSVSLYSLPTLLVLALEESDQIRNSLLQKTVLESPFTDTLSPTLVCALFLWAPTISHAFFYQNTDHVGLYAMLCYAKSLQSWLTLCDPIDGSPTGSAVPGILQARTLEWVAISFSNAWKRKVKVKSLSRVRLLATPWTAAYQAPLSMDFPGKSTGVGCHCLCWVVITD